MKIDIDVNLDGLISVSQNYCDQLADGEMIFTPVIDQSVIQKLFKTGLVESGLIENDDGYWTIGRRDGEHVLIEYKPME